MGGLKTTTKTRITGLMAQQFKHRSHSELDDPFELSESDVVWSSSYTSSSPPPSPPHPSTLSSFPVLSPTRPDVYSLQSFRRTEKMGLSAALSSTNPPSPLVGRSKPSSAARAVPPVTIPKNSSGSSDNSSGSVPGKTRFHQSAPVNIPAWPTKMKKSRRDTFEEVDDEGEEEEREIGEKILMPPHEIVASRCQSVAFSVFEGAGRTLKGRDLRRVRNAVFKKTGFLD